ncbi:subunit 17 of mediator complex-domain-containing protein [Dichotomopilus funicola]|uniref:Mediator of RNA polymerase II transcription subunit 17 n=1 Tax=Dichotomopilus funicola TaxID=1934379 RepID=A0AAN6UVX4_9PEZI|nr:subunit 17 of mediator complex-domain-containing protein [Dichotomopilus funicola]
MSDRPFSLQPRSAPHQGPQSIAEFIERIKTQPGGFRALNSAELRREIEAIEASDHDDDGGDDDIGAGENDVDMTGDASEADGDIPEIKDAGVARDEVLRSIQQTHHTAVLTLNFISLLLSKENPGPAMTTLSPDLRDMVGIGTIGATMLHGPTAMAQSRVSDHKMVAIGKRLIDLNKAADTALAASKRLQREITLETKYWSEVLGVGEEGWQTFRLPHEPQTLGVKFGFSNTGPEFKNNGIAPLRRAEDGSVKLEHAATNGGSKRLQVRILSDGVVIGRSSLPQPLAPDAPLSDRVKESRDTVFAQELWYEITREIRDKLDYVVRMSDSTATYDLDSKTAISVQLVTLGDEESATAQHPGAPDSVANELSAALGLLLCNAHRANELKRSVPNAKSGSLPPYSILRPLIAYHRYRQAVQECTESLKTLVSVLRSAGVASTIEMKEPVLAPLPGSTIPASTSLASLLLQPPIVQFDFTITPTSRLRIHLKPSPLSGASYSISLLPPLQQLQNGQMPNFSKAINPLAALCPPTPEDYFSLSEVLAHLYASVASAFAAGYFELAMTFTPASRTEPENNNTAFTDPDAAAVWGMDPLCRGIVDLDTGGQYGVHFALVPQGPATAATPGNLQLVVEGNYYVPYGQGQGQPTNGSYAQNEDQADDGFGKTVHAEWRWPDRAGQETLDDVVRQVLSSGPKQLE